MRPSSSSRCSSAARRHDDGLPSPAPGEGDPPVSEGRERGVLVSSRRLPSPRSRRSPLLGSEPEGRLSPRAREGSRASVLLAVRPARGRRGRLRHRLPVDLHDLDEPTRMAGRRRAQLRRPVQLRPPRHRPALRPSRGAHSRLHLPRRPPAARPRHGGGARISAALPFPRRAARDLRDAHDGDARRHRARLDHDVPPPARGAELPALARRHRPASLGLPPGKRDPVPRPGRDLAVDAARDADRARRPRRDPGGALRERRHRRRQRVPAVPLYHLADDRALPDGCGDHPHHRRPEELRHHLRHHAGWPGHGLRDHQPLPLQRRLRLLRRRLRLGDRRSVLRPRGRALAADAASAAAHQVDRARDRHMTARALFDRLGLAFAVLVCVSPAILFFLWMLSLSVKYEIDNAAYPPVLIPERFAWKNYASVIESNRFGLFFVNSLIVTGSATLLALAIGVPAGYGIARMKAVKAAVIVLVARMTPGLSYLIPLFLIFQWLGLIGTLLPQIIAHLVITVPIVIWIMIGYFETTPMELEEAALIDGANRWEVFRHVALPIAKPGITVAFILAVIFSWNNFVFGVVLAGRETRTLPVAVYNMLSFEQLSWGPLAAAALIVTLPVLVLTVVAQRQITGGLPAGAVKGG